MMKNSVKILSVVSLVLLITMGCWADAVQVSAQLAYFTAPGPNAKTPGANPLQTTAAIQIAQKEKDAAKRVIPATPLIPMAKPKGAEGANPESEDSLLKVGAEAPDFVSVDLKGKEIHLKRFRGKIVVLDFWATWCGPCLASLPHTQDIAKRGKDKDVAVLASCTSDTREAFEKFVKDNEKEYADIVFTCDPHERGSETYDERASNKLYGVKGIPTQFVIDRDGKIAAVIVGYGDGDHRLDDALKALGVELDTAKSKSEGK